MASSYIRDKYDIGILRTDGTTKVGMMLRSSRDEVLQYQVYDDEYLASQFFSDVPGYGSLPAEKELAIIQDDWRAGLGLEVYDIQDTKRYHKSTMDMRFKGMGIAGTKSTAVTKPSTTTSAASLSNVSMESATNWTNGARSATQAHGGTYSWGVNNVEAYQDAVTWTTDWQGKTFTFDGWLWCDTASRLRLGINDGVGSTYSGYHSGNSSWVHFSVSHTLDASATRLRCLLDGAHGTSSPFVDDVRINTPTAGTVVRWVEFNDELYMASGNVLSKLNAGGTGYDAVATFPATITDLEVFSDDQLYIALGLSDEYWEMTTAEVLKENNLANNAMKYFSFVRTSADTMYGSDGVNTIRSTTNPAAGGTAWSGQTTVDTSYHSITGLVTDSGSLYIPKENRPYYLDSSGAVQSDLAPELEALTKSTDNGKNAVFWLAKLYLPWGDQTLLEYDAGTNTWRSPALQVTGASEYNGQVFAVAGDDQYLYAILDNSTKVEVLAGRLETIGSTTGWVWHCINETTLTGCETAFISTVYQKRLWITSTAASDSIYYIPLPLGYADIAADTNRDFLTGTTMETSWLHGNFKGTAKGYPALELTMGHTYNANRYFTVKYKKLGDTSWTSIGNYTGSSASMTESKTIPDAGSAHPSSSMFKLQFTAVTNDTTITPILNNYRLKAVLYPDQREIIACRVYCANEIQLRDGTIDHGSYDAIIATLDEARTATFPFTMYDPEGNTITVKSLPIAGNTPRWRYIGNEKDRKPEREYNLLLQKITVA